MIDRSKVLNNRKYEPAIFISLEPTSVAVLFVVLPAILIQGSSLIKVQWFQNKAYFIL